MVLQSYCLTLFSAKLPPCGSTAFWTSPPGTDAWSYFCLAKKSQVSWMLILWKVVSQICFLACTSITDNDQLEAIITLRALVLRKLGRAVFRNCTNHREILTLAFVLLVVINLQKNGGQMWVFNNLLEPVIFNNQKLCFKKSFKKNKMKNAHAYQFRIILVFSCVFLWLSSFSNQGGQRFFTSLKPHLDQVPELHRRAVHGLRDLFSGF